MDRRKKRNRRKEPRLLTSRRIKDVMKQMGIHQVKKDAAQCIEEHINDWVEKLIEWTCLMTVHRNGDGLSVDDVRYALRLYDMKVWGYVVNKQQVDVK